MVYRFIQANRDQYTVREMAGLFGVSSSAYYRWSREYPNGGGKPTPS
jgi:transposase-like protein